MPQKPVTKFKYMVGIDEAGRGPLAGPLALGLVLFKTSDYKKYCRSKTSLPAGIDSKKLTENKREVWFETIKQMQKEGVLNYKVIFTSPAQIDHLGLSKVIKNSIRTGLKNFKVGPHEVRPRDCLVLLDGGLKASPEYKQKTIIKGDEKEKIIGLASICAKVMRDKVMHKHSVKFPDYFFHKNKGYGTRDHIKAINSLGLSTFHRKTFCKWLTMAQ